MTKTELARLDSCGMLKLASRTPEGVDRDYLFQLACERVFLEDGTEGLEHLDERLRVHYPELWKGYSRGRVEPRPPAMTPLHLFLFRETRTMVLENLMRYLEGPDGDGGDALFYDMRNAGIYHVEWCKEAVLATEPDPGEPIHLPAWQDRAYEALFTMVQVEVSRVAPWV